MIKLFKILFIIVPLLFNGCSFMMSRMIPINDIEKPTGEYSIGTEIFEWIDNDREEWFSDEVGDKRKLIIQVWYPSVGPGKKRDPWVDNSSQRVDPIIEEFPMPKFIARAIDRIDTDSYIDTSPITEGSFPVIIFSHGFESWRSQNTTQIQELVSHGYIVFALDHTYDALLTIFKDGTQIGRAKKYCHGCNTEEFYKVFSPQINTRIEDIRFIINQVEKIKTGEIKSNISGIIDIDRLGVFGHSFGGGTSLAVSILDSRIKSCLSLDGWYTPIHPDIYNLGLSKPFLHLGQTEWDEKINYKILDNILSLEDDIAYKLSLKGAGHLDFTDSPHISDLSSKFQLSRDLKSEEILDITNTTVLGFFDEHLKSKPSNWFDKIKKNKNIIIEMFNKNDEE